MSNHQTWFEGRRLRSSRGLAVVLLIGGTGCGTTAASAAAVHHRCPAGGITAVSGDERSAVLDVCGQRRIYRDVGESLDETHWVDATPADATTADSLGEPTTPRGREMATEVRRRIEESRGRFLRCNGSATIAVEAYWADMGTVGMRAARDGSMGPDAAALDACVAAAGAEIDVPRGTPPGRITHVVTAP